MKEFYFVFLLLIPHASHGNSSDFDTDLWHAASYGDWSRQIDTYINESGYYRFLTYVRGREDPVWSLVVQWIHMPVEEAKKGEITKQVTISELQGLEFTTPECTTKSCSEFYINATEHIGYGDTYKYTLTFPKVGEYVINKEPL